MNGSLRQVLLSFIIHVVVIVTCYISGSSTWGNKYHVGFLKTEATAELSVDIYTPGRGTSVKITGQLAGGEIDETVVVTRDSPVSIHTLVKLYYALLVFMRIAGTSQSGCGRYWS